MEIVTTPAAPNPKPSWARVMLVALLATAAPGLPACKPTMVVGTLSCAAVVPDGASSHTKDDPVALDWETGFEDPCDYLRVGGSCYRYPPIDFRLVDEPVHRGRYAAEITVVTGTDGGTQPQGRCIRDGVFPVEAYYGAWYLIPAATTKGGGLWNLLHFRADDPDISKAGLWHVHVSHELGDPTMVFELYGRLQSSRLSKVAVPIGRWFHLVVYLKRAKSATGAIALYLGDDQSRYEKILELTNIATEEQYDVTQWYVGNLASELTPPKVTVYVDDVSIRSTL